MKSTMIIATMLLSDWAAATKPNRQYPCDRQRCLDIAESEGLPFSTQYKLNGAPAGCVRYNDGRIIWVQKCGNHVNCGTNNCNGCKVLADTCKAEVRELSQGCGDNSAKQGNWCKCLPGFKMNINPKYNKPYGGWDSMYHFNARRSEGFYCVPDEEYLSSYLTTECADENGSCACDGLILYGQGKSWPEFFANGYALGPDNGGDVPCSNEEFGDPLHGTRKKCVCVREKQCDDNAEKEGNWCQCKQGFKTKLNENGKPYGGWPSRYHFNAVGKSGFVCEEPTPKPTPSPTQTITPEPTPSPTPSPTTSPTPQVYKFALRGDTGEETVEYEGKQYTLDKEPKVFESFSPITTVKFVNDGRTKDDEDKNVRFSVVGLNAALSMSAGTLWSRWKCGASDENGRCEFVRSGIFAWNSVYEIKFLEEDRKVTKAGCYKLSEEDCCAHKDGRAKWASDCVITRNVQAPSWDRKNQCQPEKFVRPSKYNRGKTFFKGDVVDCGAANEQDEMDNMPVEGHKGKTAEDEMEGAEDDMEPKTGSLGRRRMEQGIARRLLGSEEN